MVRNARLKNIFIDFCKGVKILEFFVIKMNKHFLEEPANYLEEIGNISGVIHLYLKDGCRMQSQPISSIQKKTLGKVFSFTIRYFLLQNHPFQAFLFHKSVNKGGGAKGLSGHVT